MVTTNQNTLNTFAGLQYQGVNRIDVREQSKRLAQLQSDPKWVIASELLKKATEPTSESNKIWANIIYNMTAPIRSGILDEDTVGDLFLQIPTPKGTIPDFPIDFYQNKDRDQYWAYAIPDSGNIPQRYVSTGSVMVKPYRIGSAIDFYTEQLANARWDILTRGLEVYRNGFVKKLNADGWSTILAAARFRNVVIADETAPPNTITPKLFSRMQVFMKRNGGGNMGNSGHTLTDVYISPEAAASIRSWGFDLVPESIRTQFYSVGAGMPINNIFGITLHEHEDLGIGMRLQQQFLNPEVNPNGPPGMGGELPPGKNELVIGMDRRNTGTYLIQPIVNPGLQTWTEDSSYTLRSQTMGFFGWMNTAFCALSNEIFVLGAF